MEFSLLAIFTCLSLASMPTHAALSPEAYWNHALPNTPMPKALTDLLHPEGKKDIKAALEIKKGILEDDDDDIDDGDFENVIFIYKTAEDSKDPARVQQQLRFFLEKDLQKDKKMILKFPKKRSANSVSFLPREDAENIPFTSTKLPLILKHFSLKPNSIEAEAMKKTIRVCEEPGTEGEEKYCATSLESMIDFATSKLGRNVDVFSTEVESETRILQEYVIEDVRNVSKDSLVACHKLNYAYALFYCHKQRTPSRVYKVSMVGADGSSVNALAACHVDTSAWNPKHLAFQQLSVEPGTVPICHYQREKDITWVPK